MEVFNLLKNKGIKIKRWIVALPIIGIVVFASWLLVCRLEGEKPSIEPVVLSTTFGMSQKLSLNISDQKSGLKKVWVGMLKDGKETVLFEKIFTRTDLFHGSDVKQMPLEITIEPKAMGFSDGAALLRLAVWDCSWRRWGHGNTSYIEKEILIDTKPPEIEILSTNHNISRGGAALVVYRVSESCPKSGVKVGKHIYPGHSGYFEDNHLKIAFFALRHDQGTGTSLMLEATDSAGNIAIAGFPSHIRNKKFKKDNILLSDKFLNRKIPEFEADIGGNQGTPIDNFLKVNRDLRQANYETIKTIVGETDTTMHWQGTFQRLPRSATRATFAEKRAYKYQGRTVDHQTHLGIDLASVAQSSVPAANSGRVSFVEALGIYGKTVVLDHGFGLVSMYSHLSRTSVQKDQIVKKGDIIGHTGTTGMAGGDHLHFSILIHDTFVNPIEWWDAQWIKHNVTSKLTRETAVQSE
jgi:murein DD-endopeptidase MepM/ murein hydrolase activator NlpD